MKASKLIGGVVGLVIVAAAVISVFIIDWKAEIEEPPPVVRPLKTMVVGETQAAPSRKYPGRVAAGRRVDLAFQVSGPLVEFPVGRAQEVEPGEVLARIDPRDFESNLAVHRAALEKARSDLANVKAVIARGAANPRELVDAQAAFDKAVAEETIAAKAVEDTALRAPFAGLIADKFVENFENVNAKQAILSLQDVNTVEIEINVPESVVAISKGREGEGGFVATFDFLPGREFDIQFKEFAAEADPATQTYRAIFVMPGPEDLLILPGMTATVARRSGPPLVAGSSSVTVPVDAVPIDGLGVYFVWKLRKGSGDTYTVHRGDVEVGEMIGGDILVTSGLERGDRIALAGVHLLQEGMVVRLLAPASAEPVS